MNMSGNTILITGGASGIGLRLAEEFKKLGNEVIVVGRSRDKLKLAEERGLKAFEGDVSNSESIKTMTKTILATQPSLNVVIHCAGIMKNENMIKGGNEKIIEETIATNIIGTMLLNEALMPQLLKQKSSVIMTVTSGLAYAPLSITPTYSATKAAIHSYTQSLRYQLKDTSVQVIELVPPYVQTHLMGERQANDPMAMPLEDFISEVMNILVSQPNVKEVLVERVLPQRNSADGGREKHQAFFEGLNEKLIAARKAELT